MSRKNLVLVLLLHLSLTVTAQQHMYICHADSCDTYDIQNVKEVTFLPDSFRVNEWIAYDIHQVDRIVFSQPDLIMTQWGWWGIVTEGESSYQATVFNKQLDFGYRVRFSISATSGYCQTALCEVFFEEEWMADNFMNLSSVITSDPEYDGDPYIYVKETLTGPRKFEVWVMDDPVLPKGRTWQKDGMKIVADCSQWLADRPMSEVQPIVETWVHQPVRQESKPQ